MIENSLIELRNYAKRQMTWFKHDKRIKWVKNYQQAEKLVTELLRSESEVKDEGKLQRRQTSSLKKFL